jgi:5-methylcytosine-specific restriction endonuclease McrA
MGRALVLNATYEPLAIVPARRATVLVLADKAEVVRETEAAFHSQHLTIAVPSVVRLRRFVRVPYHRRLAVSRRAVMARDDGACQYCGRFADSIDHVVPRSRGGTHVWENVVAACRPCNLRKRDRLVHEAGMRLHRQPRAPLGTAWLFLAAGSVPGDWLPFLGGPLAEAAV